MSDIWKSWCWNGTVIHFNQANERLEIPILNLLYQNYPDLVYSIGRRRFQVSMDWSWSKGPPKNHSFFCSSLFKLEKDELSCKVSRVVVIFKAKTKTFFCSKSKSTWKLDSYFYGYVFLESGRFFILKVTKVIGDHKKPDDNTIYKENIGIFK